MPQTQSKLQFKKRSISQENRPDLPEGEWDFIIPKGKCKYGLTQAKGDGTGGDPVITIVLQVEKAYNEDQESFKNALTTVRMTYFDMDDAEKRKAANMNLRLASGLAEAIGLERTDIYPDAVESEDDLKAIVQKIEGKRFHGWSVHREGMMNGEKVINIDIRFKEPGSGLVSRESDGDDEERPGKNKKAANGRGGRR